MSVSIFFSKFQLAVQSLVLIFFFSQYYLVLFFIFILYFLRNSFCKFSGVIFILFYKYKYTHTNYNKKTCDEIYFLIALASNYSRDCTVPILYIS